MCYIGINFLPNASAVNLINDLHCILRVTLLDLICRFFNEITELRTQLICLALVKLNICILDKMNMLVNFMKVLAPTSVFVPEAKWKYLRVLLFIL